MNGQLDRLKALISAEKPSIGTTVSCFLSGLTENGKSFCFYNYACHLARNQKKILMIDSKERNSFFMNQISKESIQDNYYTDYSKNSENQIQKINNNLHYLILSDSVMNDIHNLKNIISEVLKNSAFDEVLINTKSGQTDSYSNMSIISDEVFVICTPEAVSIIDAYAIIKILLKNDFEKNIKIIINKTKSMEEYFEASENMRKAVAHFLKFELSSVKAFSLFGNNKTSETPKNMDEFIFLDENMLKSNTISV